jgi:hypothetical protein
MTEGYRIFSLTNIIHEQRNISITGITLNSKSTGYILNGNTDFAV